MRTETTLSKADAEAKKEPYNLDSRKCNDENLYMLLNFKFNAYPWILLRYNCASCNEIDFKQNWNKYGFCANLTVFQKPRYNLRELRFLRRRDVKNIKMVRIAVTPPQKHISSTFPQSECS